MKSRFFTCVDIGKSTALQWKALYPRIYVQHKLDLMGEKKNNTKLGGWVGPGIDQRVIENMQNAWHKILKGNTE